MSVFHFPSSQAVEISKTVSTSAATTIVDASEAAQFVPWFQVNENNGSTPNLTVDVYDGSAARYLASDDGATFVARAVAAKSSQKFTLGYVIPKGSVLRVTSSDASGRFHVHGVAVRSY